MALGESLPVPYVTVGDETFYEKADNRWLEMWRSIVANKAALISLFFICFLVFVAVFGPYFTPYNPIETNMANALKPPSVAHWFGTDQLGMDIFSRVIVGTRVSLTVGLLAVSIALTIGVILGSVAGYVGGLTDTIVMRAMDVMLAIPSILLAITLMAALGKGIDKAVIAIGLVSIPEYARLVRGNILSIKENDYVAAARISGNSDFRIIFWHVLPAALSVIVVRATLGISAAVLDTAALGFLGMGVQPPQAEWGDMLGRARSFIFQAPHTMIFPGLAITLTVLAFNLVGDGMRDALDPKSRIK
ncbi:MAG: ABC transporter permease [Actinobacteria bacterium HGW-Actinobacteria-7]|nr:MAG: ABC transporter permease [Actinobacteria bacterium HGW-Actinobacteria-7]